MPKKRMTPPPCEWCGHAESQVTGGTRSIGGCRKPLRRVQYRTCNECKNKFKTIVIERGPDKGIYLASENNPKAAVGGSAAVKRGRK